MGLSHFRCSHHITGLSLQNFKGMTIKSHLDEAGTYLTGKHAGLAFSKISRRSSTLGAGSRPPAAESESNSQPSPVASLYPQPRMPGMPVATRDGPSQPQLWSPPPHPASFKRWFLQPRRFPRPRGRGVENVKRASRWRDHPDFTMSLFLLNTGKRVWGLVYELT